MTININTSIQDLQSSLDCSIRAAVAARDEARLRSLRLDIALAWRDEARGQDRSSMLRMLEQQFRRVSRTLNISADIEQSKEHTC